MKQPRLSRMLTEITRWKIPSRSCCCSLTPICVCSPLTCVLFLCVDRQDAINSNRRSKQPSWSNISIADINRWVLAGYVLVDSAVWGDVGVVWSARVMGPLAKAPTAATRIRMEKYIFWCVFACRVLTKTIENANVNGGFPKRSLKCRFLKTHRFERASFFVWIGKNTGFWKPCR